MPGTTKPSRDSAQFAGQVNRMFDRVASRYDALNSVMTAGLHHRWRERAADRAEQEAVEIAMRDAEGDRARAAARLGISLSTLGRRLRAGEES